MENPAEEIKSVVRGLVCKPMPKQQEEILRRYFKPDARLYDIDLNQSGLENLIPTYNFATFLLHYQDVYFHNILYDEGQNALSLHITLHVRPTAKFFAPETQRMFVLVELENGRDSRDGRVKKYIKVQRNFVQRDPAIKFVPVIGDVYDSDNLRFLVGRLYAYIFHTLKAVWTTTVPQYFQQAAWELWIRGPHGPPGKSGGTRADDKFDAWVHADNLGDQSTYKAR